MANYHVLAGLPDGNAFRVVFHIGVPGTGNNRAGIQWREALVDSGLGGTTVLPDGDGTGGTISTAEKALIESGAVIEYGEDVATNPGENAAAFKTRLDSRHAALATSVPAALQGRLTYFGYVSV